MSNNPCLLSGHLISSDGKATSVTLDQANKVRREQGLVWLHLCSKQPGSREWMKEHSGMDPVVIESLLAKDTRPRIIKKQNGVMMILRAMNLNPDEEPEDMISCRIWMEEGRVITTHTRNIKSIDEMIVAIEKGDAPTTAGDFLTFITDKLFARMSPILEKLEDDISSAEEGIARNLHSDLSDGISKYRKQLAIFIRHIVPQKRVIEQVLELPFSWIEEHHKQQLGEGLDQVTRYTEELYELKERTQILNEEVRNVHAEKQSNLTYTFSVVATIFLPLGFIAKLLAIRMGGMPDIDSENAFSIFILMCVILVMVQVAIFKKLKWF